MFERVLIANRGEIAVRIAATCAKLGISPVGVYSDVDSGARHVAACDDAVHLPGVEPQDTYLNVPAVLDAAARLGAEAVHPGYGFLSEDAAFAEAVVDAGLVWVGPPAEALRAAGDKVRARRIAAHAGVPVVPGTDEPCSDAAAVQRFVDEHGLPVAVKAAGGGGGRGLKIVRSFDEIEDAFSAARREAQAYFSSSDVYVERYLEAPKHLEVQVLAASPEEAMWIGVRDCSLQRRNQKLVEETPPARWRELSEAMGEAAVAFSKACGYVGAGTVEMLVDENGAFFFLEMNARLQVEHTVTEEVFGLDLVACQLRIAAGDSVGFSQEDLTPRGHAVECRINAEDPTTGFAPSPGRLTAYAEPQGAGVRVDSGYGEGDEIPAAYDSLIAKLVTWGSDRGEALQRMKAALDDFVIEGVPTTIPAHQELLSEPSFVSGDHTTTTVEKVAAEGRFGLGGAVGVVAVKGRPARLWHPAMAAAAPAAGGAAAGALTAPMQAVVLEVRTKPGAGVAAGEPLIVLEAMKMETVVAAPRDGVVAELKVAPGETVEAGRVLLELE